MGRQDASLHGRRLVSHERDLLQVLYLPPSNDANFERTSLSLHPMILCVSFLLSGNDTRIDTQDLTIGSVLSSNMHSSPEKKFKLWSVRFGIRTSPSSGT